MKAVRRSEQFCKDAKNILLLTKHKKWPASGTTWFASELLVNSACGVDCCLHTGFLLSPKFLESPTQLRWSTLHKCQRNVFQSEVRKKMCKANTFYGWTMGTVSRGYRKHFCPFDFCRSLFLARLLFKWSRYLKVHTSKCCMRRRLCFLHIYVLHTSLTYYHYLLKLFMMNRQTFMLLGLIFLIFKCLLFVNVLDPLFFSFHTAL